MLPFRRRGRSQRRPLRGRWLRHAPVAVRVRSQLRWNCAPGKVAPLDRLGGLCEQDRTSPAEADQHGHLLVSIVTLRGYSYPSRCSSLPPCDEHSGPAGFRATPDPLPFLCSCGRLRLRHRSQPRGRSVPSEPSTVDGISSSWNFGLRRA